jgi:hypothetical protein
MRAAFLLAAGLPAFFAPQDVLELKSAVSTGADLKVEWKTSTLPDGATLTLRIGRLEERFKAGALKADEQLVGSSLGFVKDGALLWTGPTGGPGSYRVTAELLADLQKLKVIQALKERNLALPQKWSFEFEAWGDALAAQLGRALEEFDKQEAKAQALVQQGVQASASRETWRAATPKLTEDIRALEAELGTCASKQVFTAAGSRLVSAVGILFGAMRFARFDRGTGKLTGFFNMENPQDPVVKFEDEVLSWDCLKRRLADMKETAGREFALWALKDMRRTAGRPSPALLAALQAGASHAGLAPFADRLMKGSPPRELEAEIRTPKK